MPKSAATQDEPESNALRGRCTGTCSRLPLHFACRIPLGKTELFDREFTLDHVHRDALSIERNGPIPKRGREETCKRAHFEFWAKVHGAIHRRVSKAGESTDQSVARHGSCVPVSAFVLVPGIARAPVVAAAKRSYNRQALFNKTFLDQVRCHLVLDAGPYLVRVNEG